MNALAAIDLAPLAGVALFGALLALLPLIWVGLRHRGAEPAERLGALTWVTLFLTFDLVLFGAFTRLTDSGLGCPDWPGCYGNASPIGAHADIIAAQTTLPSGPVTQGKAWVEMVHRYLASAVGVLILVLAVASWWARWQARRAHGKGWTDVRGLRAPLSPWWATATLAWVLLQGAFGALTVTMKLYPAIVTAHLLGGIGLLVLLAAQTQAHARAALRLPAPLFAGIVALALLVLVQIALGGWVSTNYAVLACSDFPTCQGEWWPAMDFENGFALRRALGAGKDGGFVPFAALTAIHYLHRLTAYAVLAAIVLLAGRLRAEGSAAARHWAFALAAVAAWQLASGLANVLLGWPLLAAVAHTAGAAALAVLLTVLIVRVLQARRRAVASARVGASAHLAS
jgi:cytochrome c oxidase assembly protein subunit 15